MKKGVYIINTSRGALVNTKDCIAALKNKKIGGLGLDVYEDEENVFF
jgi:D-lactate dehydrogenase